MSLDLGYLKQGLITPDGMRTDLAEQVSAVARAWLEEGVDPALIEVASEYLARTAEHLGTGRASWGSMAAGIAWIDLPQSVTDYLSIALKVAVTSDALAALAIHMLDIAERAALELFVPELPSVSAKSERTADAARRVGSARHLKG